MTIKKNGGIFGRNTEFNDVSVTDLSVTDEITILENGVDVGGVRSLSGEAQLAGKTTGITFGLQSVVPTNGGSVIQNGTRDIGNGSNFWRNVYVSTGIYFGSQTNATHFDDYEEGTWTPVPADAASGGNTGSAATAVGHYTKVGRVVTVAVDLVNIDKTGLTAGNAFFLQGLPFAAASLTGSIQFTGISSGGSTFGGTVVAPVVYDANSAIRFFDPTGTITDSYLVSDVAANADIRFSLTYFA